MRTITAFAALALPAALLAAPGQAATMPTVFSATAANPAGLAPTVDAFRDALGPLNANAPVNNAGGRRQINWDAAPDAVSDPNEFPGDFFNADVAPRARGIEFQATGATTGFELSATAASGEPPLFGLPRDFQFFSPERIFRPVGGDTFDVLFFDPRSPEGVATTTGLGVVFTDVELAGEASMSFFDIDGGLLFQQDVATAGDIELSFLGVIFDSPLVAKVSIVSGAGGNTAMDDFIFGEPTPVAPVPLPAAAWMLLAGLGGLAALGRRRA